MNGTGLFYGFDWPAIAAGLIGATAGVLAAMALGWMYGAWAQRRDQRERRTGEPERRHRPWWSR